MANSEDHDEMPHDGLHCLPGQTGTSEKNWKLYKVTPQ